MCRVAYYLRYAFFCDLTQTNPFSDKLSFLAFKIFTGTLIVQLSTVRGMQQPKATPSQNLLNELSTAHLKFTTNGKNNWN